MDTPSQKEHSLVITVDQESGQRITTLLQSGIGLESNQGTAIGVFLNNIPGFDMGYLTDRVQTIFYDGNAVDDLEQCFSGPHHVIALSAAMPGLAGAIFRRNSLCAALRTRKSMAQQSSVQTEKNRITLKLFNAIAQEKGMEILGIGGKFSAETLIDFFSQRSSLLATLRTVKVDTTDIPPLDLPHLLEKGSEYHVTITEA